MTGVSGSQMSLLVICCLLISSSASHYICFKANFFVDPNISTVFYVNDQVLTKIFFKTQGVCLFLKIPDFMCERPWYTLVSSNVLH